MSYARVFPSLWKGFFLLLLASPVIGLEAAAQGQPASDEAAATYRNPYGSGAGLEILLTNSGFGLGAYYQRTLGKATSLIAHLSLGSGKDEREFKFTSYFGQSQIQNKANYLLMLPVQLGIQRRLFQDAIEDNFRPYLHVAAGPTLGWEYPYFRDCDGDGKLNTITDCGDGDTERTYDAIGGIPRGSFQMGLGGLIAIGANFGLSKKVTQGIRIGYGFSYFFDEIQLLEPDIQDSTERFFGTPTISLTFGRVFSGVRGEE